MIDKHAPHTLKLLNLVKAQKRYRLSQTTASAHSKQTKLELMLDFHFMFSYSILILCLKMERCDYYDNIFTDIR